MTTNGGNSMHLGREIGILRDCLLREVRCLRQAGGEGAADHLPGLVLSEEEVLAILSDQPAAAPKDSEAIARSKEELTPPHPVPVPPEGSHNALERLTGMFDLDRFEQQCLVLCLASEIEPRYARVYAYLQDDVTRKLPSIELALRLFSQQTGQTAEAGAVFCPQAALRKNKLIEIQDVRDVPVPLSQRWIRLDERIAAFLLETPELDPALVGWVNYRLPEEESTRGFLVSEELGERVGRLADACFADGEIKTRPVFHLYGKYGSGKRELAENVCQVVGLPLLVANAVRLAPTGDRLEAWWRLGRESLLQPAALFVDNFDDLLEGDRGAERDALLEAIRMFSPLTFLSGRAPWRGMERSQEQIFLSLECRVPASPTRVHMWKRLLDEVQHQLNDNDIAELSSKFRFTAGQVRDAFASAKNRAVWTSQPPPPLDLAMLNQACRSQATPNLGQLARRVEPTFGWNDIVLPEAVLAQLREIAAHIRRSQVVLEQWGFASKFPYGQGVTGLFHGGSGTGKTMAVSIIAADLALDLYKIDLSMVVSKYIGETEKNLNRVFAEAQDSNAILFFDEADALFGKRSQVKDAHDRYANIETAYLLQRMEEYDGAVILASNMKHNLDEAFVRRMRFILHFPFPGEAERERIWRSAFPPQAPLGKDVDFSWLARKLKITGGYIKNISLRAAFLAVERRGVIAMDCLKEAARLEMEKIGKITELVDFQRPQETVTNPEPAKEVAA